LDEFVIALCIDLWLWLYSMKLFPNMHSPNPKQWECSDCAVTKKIIKFTGYLTPNSD